MSESKAHQIQLPSEAGQFRQRFDLELERNKAINRLLRAALNQKSLREILIDCIDIILSVSWLSILPKAGIFLAEENRNNLFLFADRNLSPPLLEACRKIPFGCPSSEHLALGS